MSESPLVSVIIPARDAEAYIGAAVRSALSQTYENLEVLVVDDGSHDATPEIIQEIAMSDPRLIFLRQKNAGVAAARNLAIEASQGEFIAPLDADDLWFPQKIEKQVRCFDREPENVGLVYSWWVSIDGASNIMHAGPKWRLEGALLEPLVVTNFIGNASVPLIRRDCIDAVGAYKSNLHSEGAQGCEDWDLALRIAAGYHFGFVPQYLVGYRRLVNSMSRNGESMSRSYELVIEGLTERHADIPSALLRWSRSRFYAYLSGMNSEHELSLHWIFKAFVSDPTLCLSAGMVRRLLSLLLGIASPPLHYYPQDGEGEPQTDEVEMEAFLNGVMQSTDHEPFPATWKPYARISRWRWNRMMHDLGV